MRQRLALQRDQHFIGRGQRSHCQDSQRRRAVQQDPVVRALQIRQQIAHHEFATMLRGQRVVGRSKIDGGRQQVNAVRRAEDGSRPLAAQQCVGRRSIEILGIKPERKGRTCLRIKVHHEHPRTRGHQGRGQIDDRGRLGHPALLIGDGQYPRLR